MKVPELSIGQGTGTEVRIPGFGKVGVLPKLDFGLELLYGATESKGLPAGQDRARRRANSRHHQAPFLIASDGCAGMLGERFGAPLCLSRP